MTTTGMTAITNIILAGEALFATGLLMGRTLYSDSASFYWSLAMLFLGISAILGAIDHGFFEDRGNTKTRIRLMHITWFAIGFVTFFVLFTIASQFVNQRYHSGIHIFALMQLIVFFILVKRINRFLVVIINYIPVMLVFLLFNFFGISDGSGSWYMIVGLLLSFIASILNVLKIKVSELIDHNSVYHFVMMIAVVFLYLGGVVM